MNPENSRRVADALTWSRILSVVPISMLAVYGQWKWVFFLYIAAALTDLLDGYFARRGSPASSDLDFDGIADLIMSIATLYWLWLLIPDFISSYWVYLPALVLLEAYMTFARLTYPSLVVPHLNFGRHAMAVYFLLLPALIIWGDLPWFVHFVFLLGTASKMQLAWAIVTRVRVLKGND